MPKEVKKTKKSALKPPKKLGRPLELKRPENLPTRFRETKMFLENYWGTVGLALKSARDPEDVRTALLLVPGIEWKLPFHDYGHARCLIREKTTKVDANVMRETRRKLESITKRLDALLANFHNLNQSARQASATLASTIAQFGLASRFEFFFIIAVVARVLQVRELGQRFRDVEKSLNETQKEKKVLKEALDTQEAWCARQELVKFAKNRRNEKSLLNFTRVIAGLPEWGWFHSRRECEKIVDKSSPAPPYQIFQLLVKITRSMKPLKLRNVEKKLRAELIHNTIYGALQSYVIPNWDFLEESVRFCEGKDFKRSEIPYKIMGRFLYHLDRPKSSTEVELARLNQLR